MRMPIFSYFLVMGTLLAGLLIWISSIIEPEAPGVQASQFAGVPKFKPEPEPRYATVTTFNFAAEHAARPALKPAKVIEAAARPKTINRSVPPQSAWNQLAEYPHDNLSIH
jgi:hypothetical protein